MPFSRPDLAAINTDLQADIETRLPGGDARPRRSLLGVLATVFAGATHGLYDFISFTADQILPDTADAEHLARHASLWGLTRGPAVAAAGNVDFTGTDASVIAAGSILRRGDGAEFTTTAEAVIAAGAATAPVIASGAAADGDSIASTVLTFTTPVAGVSSSALVAAGGLTGGADSETDAALRARVLTRIQKPPAGGAGHDYEAWALARQDHGVAVTRAWVFPRELGIGGVTVRFTMDDDAVIPVQADLDAVQAYMDANRPVTAQVTVVAPVASALNFTIDIAPDTTAVRAAITAELTDLLRREAIPGGTILISHIRESVSIAAGETDHAVLSPAADAARATGLIATMGVVTWGAL